MKTLYLIRHGLIPRHTPRKFIGKTDLHLTPEGRSQLVQLAEYLRNTEIDHYFCSPLSRCVESCEILCSLQQQSFQKISGLREIDLGEWEGLTVEEVRQQFPGHYEQRGRDLVHYRPTGGESFLDLQQRAWPAFEDIVQTTCKSAVIVAHAGVNRVLLCTILGLKLADLFTIQQDYGCLNIIHHDQNHYHLKTTNFLPPS